MARFDIQIHQRVKRYELKLDIIYPHYIFNPNQNISPALSLAPYVILSLLFILIFNQASLPLGLLLHLQYGDRRPTAGQISTLSQPEQGVTRVREYSL